MTREELIEKYAEEAMGYEMSDMKWLLARFASEITVDADLLKAVKLWREVCDRYDRDDFRNALEKQSVICDSVTKLKIAYDNYAAAIKAAGGGK